MNSKKGSLEKIQKSLLKFLQPLSSEEVYAEIIKEGAGLLEAQDGSLVLEKEGEFKLVYSSLLLPTELKVRRNGAISEILQGGKIAIKNTRGSETIFSRLKKTGIKSNIFVPLLYKGKASGVLVIHSIKEGEASLKDLETLRLFATFASLVIRKTQLYEETKKALELRDLFISMAAHELRTPITTIHGYVQLLNSKMADTNTNEARWVKELHAESLRLISLVHELLETNRIKTGQFHFYWKECNLREIIERAVNNFKFNHPQRKLLFKDEISTKIPLIIGDFDKLIQVITNLLDNAAKFSSQDTAINLTLKSRAAYFILQIKDSGVGIDKKDLPKIFDGYYKGEISSTKKGMGLGLFITKSILEEHRGSIDVRSRLNKGTAVEVRIPKTNFKNNG